MRITRLLTLSLAGTLATATLPALAPAQLNISVVFGAKLGPEVGVFAYSNERQGDWRGNYKKWTPVTLYDVNGHYYHNAVRGSRAVVVYSYNNEYFLPPSDQAWVGFDKRYNYKHRPNADDMGRVRPYAPVVAVDVKLGHELGVVGYSAERAGDWRKNYKRWTPVTVYEVNGHYYPNHVDGARAVEIYRYRDEYFLPPHEDGWIGFDKRYDYKHQPTDEDRARVRIKF